jgi:hypothetical protein
MRTVSCSIATPPRLTCPMDRYRRFSSPSQSNHCHVAVTGGRWLTPQYHRKWRGHHRAALHGVRLLLDDLQQLKDAPKTVRRLADDVQFVDTAIKLLENIEDREWGLLGTSVAEESKTTTNSCTQACELFRPELQRWTRHSEDGKLA